MTDNDGPQHPYGRPDPFGWQPQGAPDGRPRSGLEGRSPAEPGWQPQGAPAPSSPPGPGGWQPPGPQHPGPGYPPQWQGQPGQGQPGYWPQGYGQPGPSGPSTGYGYPQQGIGSHPGQPDSPGKGSPRKSRTAVIVTAIAVVVALLAGGSFLYFGNRDTKTAGGQGNPQDAANAMLLSLTQKDPIGVADQLDPAEATLFADFTGDILTELKRLHIVDSSAGAGDLTGSTVTVSGLAYDNKPEQINDHLSVVKLTAGTVTVVSDPSKLPVTDKIKNAAGDQLSKVQPTSRTVNIADEVRKLGHPIRISTVKRDGKWYPSLFYTAADYWAQSKGTGNPTAADSIPAVGGGSPQDTMNKLLDAVTRGDATAAISLLPPDEMGVLHDYGKLLTRNTSPSTMAGKVKFSNATWDVSDVTGGKKVSLKTLTATVNGKDYALVRDPAAGSLTVTAPGEAPVVLGDTTLESFISRLNGESSPMAPQLVKIIKSEFKQVIGLGVVMTESGGKWYASPLRSYTGIFTSLLKGLDAGDVDYLISLAKK